MIQVTNEKFTLEYESEEIAQVAYKGDYMAPEEVVELMNKMDKEIEQLKQDDLIFFQQVFHILLKYQHLFNREMADEVLDELGIELTDWFE